jgi:hypothetical protein
MIKVDIAEIDSSSPERQYLSSFELYLSTSAKDFGMQEMLINLIEVLISSDMQSRKFSYK